MFRDTFYHGTLRKYTIAFGNLFNDISVVRKNSSDQRVQTIAVPLAYGPKQKFLVRLNENPKLDKKVAITLPRMGFEITDISYNPQRKLGSTIKSAKTTSDGDTLKTQFTPVPYDITYTLSIFAKNADDGAQIIEQILPYFRPEFTTRVNLIPEMDVTVDTPVILQSLSIEDTYEGNFETRKVLIYNLTFTVKGYMYGPVTTQGLIKRVKVNLYDNAPTDDSKIQTITTEPSLYANGSPLFSPSANSQLSIPISQIDREDDYGFSIDIDGATII